MPSPPPERPEATRARSNIIFSFWAIILFLGLPTWWYTTSIPRAALPIQQMLEWETDQAHYQVDVQIAAPNLDQESLRELIAASQKLVDEHSVFPAFKVNILPLKTTFTSDVSILYVEDDADHTKMDSSVLSGRFDLLIELREGNTYELNFRTEADPIIGTYNPDKVAGLPAQIADSLHLAFLEEKALVAHQYSQRGDPADGSQAFLTTLAHDTISTITSANTRAFKTAPSYHLTFSLFTAGGSPSSWDISSALKRYVQPFVHSLSRTSKLSITTQIQMYSAMSPSIVPVRLEGRQGTFLNSSDLTAFINTAEWPLSPSIGSGPTINFVLYIPSKDQLPLQIQDSESGSWIISQWGGVSIWNPPLVTNPDTQVESVVSHLDIDMLQPSFEVFQSQLLMLLGVPTAQNLSLSTRMQAFQRLSGLALYLRATSNLGSLARLAQRLSNIPIPHHVVRLVESSITALMQFRELGDFRGARAAYAASEKAFFDKSMIGQVYFPDEHKVAVYLPLLGPIGVPLVVGLIREVRQRILASRAS